MTTNQTWQPIETAPRDGALVDLWMDGTRYTDCHFDATTDKWRERSIWLAGEITHWMPLPQPPLDNHRHDGVESTK